MFVFKMACITRHYESSTKCSMAARSSPPSATQRLSASTTLSRLSTTSSMSPTMKPRTSSQQSTMPGKEEEINPHRAECVNLRSEKRTCFAELINLCMAGR